MILDKYVNAIGQYFTSLSGDNPQSQKVIVLFIVVLMLLSFFITSTLTNVKSPIVQRGKTDAEQFSYFDLYDAEALCQGKMEQRLGAKLLRSYMDQHSSRTENMVFRVYFKADVGTLKKYDEVTVYCYVDKWDYELSYFREVNPNVRKIKSTDLKFFTSN